MSDPIGKSFWLNLKILQSITPNPSTVEKGPGLIAGVAEFLSSWRGPGKPSKPADFGTFSVTPTPDSEPVDPGMSGSAIRPRRSRPPARAARRKADVKNH